MKSALAARLAQIDAEKNQPADTALYKLKEHASNRLKEIRGQMLQTFAKLEKYKAIKARDYSDRLSGKEDEAKTIFDKSNEAAEMVSGVVEFLRARVNKDTFGSTEWYSARVEDLVGMQGDSGATALAEKIQPHSAMKMRECNWREVGREALGVAFDLGIAVLKTSYRKIVDVSEEIQMILVERDGTPVVAKDGSFFLDTDELVIEGELLPEQAPQPANVLAFPTPGVVSQPPAKPEPDEPEGPGDAASEAADSNAEAEEAMTSSPAPKAGFGGQENAETLMNTGEDGGAEGDVFAPAQVFTKDPDQEGPTAANGRKWLEHLVEEPVILGRGLDVRLVDYRDFGYPVNAAAMNLDDPACDFIYHTREASLEDLIAQFAPEGFTLEPIEGATEPPDFTEWREKFTKLKAGGGISQGPQSEGAKAKLEYNEAEAQRTDEDNPSFKVTECYFRKRILTKGPESRVFMVIVESGTGGATCSDCEVMYVEYLSRICAKSAAPLHLLAVNKVAGRAFGIGFYEIHEIAANIVDRLLNGILVRNEQHCDPIKGIKKGALDALAAGSGDEIMLAPGKFLLVGQGVQNVNEAFSYFALPDLDERTWQMVNLFMSLIQTRSGVTNAAQGDLTNLPSNGTATGVNSLLESSSVIHNFTLEEVRSALRGPLQYGVLTLYFRQEVDEVFELSDPSTPGATKRGVMSLAEAQAIAKMQMTVDILLTRAKKQEEKEALMQAIPMAEKFLLTYPPEIQLRMLSMYKQVMAAMGADNADAVLPTREEILQTIQQQAMAQQQQLALTNGQPPAEEAGEQPQPEPVPDNVIPGQEFAA